MNPDSDRDSQEYEESVKEIRGMRDRTSRWIFVITVFLLITLTVATILFLTFSTVWILLFESFHSTTFKGVAVISCLLLGLLVSVTVMLGEEAGIQKYFFAAVAPNYILVTINNLSPSRNYVLYEQGIHPRYPWEEIHGTHHISLEYVILSSDKVDGIKNGFETLTTQEVTVLTKWQIKYRPIPVHADRFFRASKQAVEQQYIAAVRAALVGIARKLTADEVLNNSVPITDLIRSTLHLDIDLDKLLDSDEGFNFTPSENEAAELDTLKKEGKPRNNSAFEVRIRETRKQLRDIAHELRAQNPDMKSLYGIEVGGIRIYDADFTENVQAERERARQLIDKLRQIATYAGININSPDWQSKVENLPKDNPAAYKLALDQMNIDRQAPGFKKQVFELAGVDTQGMGSSVLMLIEKFFDLYEKRSKKS